MLDLELTEYRFLEVVAGFLQHSSYLIITPCKTLQITRKTTNLSMVETVATTI